MVAAKAREDFEDLRAEGLAPTLDDFDRLNQLALRLERGPEPTLANAPRIGWAGGIAFHEPTVQALEWYERYALRTSATAGTFDTFWYFALAHAREPRFFDALTGEREIADAVRKWASGVTATREEVERACAYAEHGYDDAKPGENPNGAAARPRLLGEICEKSLDALFRRVARACATLGIPRVEAIAETPSALDYMYYLHAREAGAKFDERDVEAYADYKWALYEIRERLKAEAGGAAHEEQD